QQLHVLKAATYAQARDLARRQRVEPLIEKAHTSAGCLQYTGNEVEGRALAGAVGADQAHDFAGPHTEADVVDRDKTTEFFADSVHFQHDRVGFRPGAFRQDGRLWRRSLPAHVSGAASEDLPPVRQNGPDAVARILQ